MTINKLTGIVVDCAVQIHKRVGPGCFEFIYERILEYELSRLGVKAERQVVLPLTYDSMVFDKAYKVDLLVEGRLIVEMKSVEEVHPLHFKQVSTYLHLADLKHGMILNFNANKMADGIFRVFNNFGRE